MLVPKGLLGFHGVGGDAEHRRAAFGKGILQAGEVDRLPGAAGGVGTRVEKQHQFLPGVIGQRDAVATVTG